MIFSTIFQLFIFICFVLNNGKELVSRLDSNFDECLLLGYSTNSKAYQIFNKHTVRIKESMHAVLDETNAQKLGKVPLYDYDYA